MVVVIQQIYREALDIIGRAEQQKVFRILHSIACRAYWIKAISKIMLEFAETQLAETKHKLSKI